MPIISSIQKTGFGLFRASSSPFLQLTLLDFISASTTTSLIHPASVQVGDLCIIMQYGYDDDGEEYVFGGNVPTGFNQFSSGADIGSIQTSVSISYRILTSTAAITVSQPGLDEFGYIAVYYRISNGTLNTGSVTYGPASLISGYGTTTANSSFFSFWNLPALASSANLAVVGLAHRPSSAISGLGFSGGSLQPFEGTATNTKALLGVGIVYGPVSNGATLSVSVNSSTYAGAAYGYLTLPRL
jgi:hypothetical protein